MGKRSEKREVGRIVDSGADVGNTLLGNRLTYALLMSLNPPEPTEGSPQTRAAGGNKVLLWVSIALSVALLVWFYVVEKRFGGGRDFSAYDWIKSAWNDETDYEHGVLFPFVIAGLIGYKFKELKAAASDGSGWGLLAVFVGVLFYVASYRTLQPRIAMVGLPFILWGSAFYLWGWRVARMLTFPLFFFWLAIPLPSFQQATTHLQLLATSLAHHGSALCGVQTYVEGTTVLPLKGDWKPLDIAKGCSGIRSLMALLMISATWAYIAKMAMWKRVLLFFCAFPLAILGNALRVISIFVIAEYGNAKWASTTWHDWSGLLLFYPFSLMLLLVIHSVLEGGLPWKKGNQRTLRRMVVTSKDESKPFLSES
ncbi:MAG: exosortase/archaeosortase family protein [Luteolibacter sp.]